MLSSISSSPALLKNITFAIIVASSLFFVESSDPKTRDMNFTASQIALLINGKIEGDANAAVNSFGKIEEAQRGQLAFLANPKYEDHLYSTQASVIIINENLELK